MWMLLILLLACPVVACDKGCVEYNRNCACEAKADNVPLATELQPSDEKPPRSGSHPWESSTIHADMGHIAPQPVTPPVPEDVGKTIPNGGVPVK
jgi:hypothetical protein